ncbi:MAG: glycoside hydrolase family 57 protein [Verrucomicrobiota bacterium]
MMNVVFLWHMHQPYYVNPLTKTALMPWVRLHAVKGYLDMIMVGRMYPEVHLNFNFTPVLIKQLQELAQREVTDAWEELSRKPASELSHEDKIHILENFFKIHWDNLIYPFPRYKELLDLRGQNYDLTTIKESTRHFEDQDYLDLQTWYNLSWCGFSAEENYPELKELKRKARGFTEEEKNRVLDIHHEIVCTVLNYYREAKDAGQVEITTTPFYHPIMPLVYNTDFAHRCMPGRELPPPFSAPDDVKAHLRMAQELHESVFGEKAKGLWPSEGSVAPELIPHFKEEGIEYFCTDEKVLFQSLPPETDHIELFKTWACEFEGARVNALFRERPLSDFVGFNAARQTDQEATDFLIHHLEHLDEVVPSDNPNRVVGVVLDGENAWETFHDGGKSFLHMVYQRIQASHKLRARRLGDVFAEFPPHNTVHHLHSGSWINGDFDIWIGDGEENRGWEWLGKTRNFLIEYAAENTLPSEVLENAWREIYAAEGSDWFWWYGPDFQTDSDFLFDELFRTHLKNVYYLLNEVPPKYLSAPIRQKGRLFTYTVPTSYIYPELEQDKESYFDWMGAGHMNLENSGGAMYQSDRIARELYFGFNPENIFLRFDYKGQSPDQLIYTFHKPEPARIVINREASKHNKLETYLAKIERSKDGVRYYSRKETVHLAIKPQRIELSTSVHALDWKSEGETVTMTLQILENGTEKEIYPSTGLIEFTAPSPKFTLKNWFV